MKTIINDLRKTLYGVEGSFFSRLFDAEVSVISRDCGEDYVQRCVDHLENLPDDVLIKLLSATSAYALEFVDEYGIDPDEEWDFQEGSPVRDILKYVCPVCIRISASDLLVEEDMPPAFDLELSCVWELEHGLEWTVRGDKAVYVGSFEGKSPWGEYDGKDWNYLTRI